MKILLMLVCLASAGLVGVPIGLLVKSVNKTGYRLPMVAAMICACISIVLGEIGYGAWRIYREIGVFDLRDGWMIFPHYVRHGNLLYLGLKIAAAVVAVVVAYEIARPKSAQGSLLR
jgi:hypothetical protein